MNGGAAGRSASQLPPALAQAIDDELQPGETVLTWFEPNLDASLRYASGLIALTSRRVLAYEPRSDGQTALPRPQSWQLGEVTALRAKENLGVGLLELLGASSRLAAWRYTGAQSAAAQRLVRRFGQWQREAGGGAENVLDSAAVCPSCGAPIPEGDTECPACVAAPAPPAYSSLLRLVLFARNRAVAILLGLALTILSTAVGLIPPYLTMPLLDNVLIPHQSGQHVDPMLVVYYLAGFALAALVAWLLSWAKTYVLAWVSERVASDLRNRTYAHLQELSLEFFGGKRTGDLIARLSSDTDRICYFISVHLLDFSSDLLMIVLSATVLLSIDPVLALWTLLPFPLIAWMIHRVRVKLRQGFHQGNRAWSEMTNVLADTIPGVRVVKAFAQEQREVARFARSNDHILAANDRVNRVWSFFWPMVALLTELGLLVIWACGAYRVFQGSIRVGVLTAFLAYISRFYGRLESMSRIIASTQRAASSAQRIFEILDRLPSVAEPQQPVEPGRLRGEIDLRGVSFKYGSHTVIDNVSLQVRPGEMIGLVGSSGAGKSTLVNLVCRFYDVTDGAILVDGHDVRAFPIAAYRRHIGIVLQEPFLFYGTIAENIAYGRPAASRGEIVEAAKAARAHEFILRLPDGYDSLVGERGQSLSGGERQRISIARALLINPAILILDEATSSVDTQTEREIQEALDNLTRGRTTIAIAHRLSTLRKADRLVVMERGRIVEIGHHDELLKIPGGAFARLHRAQMELAAGLGQSE